MAADDPNPDVELKKLVDDFKKAGDDVRKFAETSAAEMKNLGAITNETKEKADKALTEMNAIGLRMTDIEQKMVRRSGADPTEQRKTIGQIVVDDKGIQDLMERKNGAARVIVEMKDIMSGPGSWGSGVSPTSSLVVAERVPIIQPPMRQLVVRDLLMPGTTASNAIEYPVETDDPASTAAAPVSEGARKPQSDIRFDLRNVPVRTIAHFMKASRQILDDAPMLMSYIDGRLVYGLGYAEEFQLLYGDGTGQNLLGIIPQATAYVAAFAPTNPTNIDTLRLASLQATNAYYPATGYTLHPTDWAKIELTKDTQGRYIVGQPETEIAARLWGLPVVQTPAMQVGHFLTGSFRLAAQIFDRMQKEVMISTEDQDNFVRNMVTIRAEERLALAVYRPAAFIYGTLT
jgi:HK97 family phage major capsid protein